MSCRILIVDDHVAIQRGLREILSANLEIARLGYARSGQDAVEQASNEAWDVAVVDLNLPGQGGLELVRSLKEAQPAMRILIYSMHGEDQFGVRALRAGADGYVTKDSPAEEIPRAVRNLLQHGQHINARLAAAMAQSIGTGSDYPTHLLSDREHEVLRMIASGKTPAEISRELSVSMKTVSRYRARLLEKLNLKNTAELIRYAIDRGLA
jgi:two-component system, NarL family, invasion response regulator UvrY